MKKFLISILACSLIIFSLSFFACDLSHKHYTDNFGVCKNCNEDISILIDKDKNGAYIQKSFNLQLYTDTYLKFVSNGESQLTIKVESTASNIKSIILYSKTDDYIASTYNSENPILTCNEQLIAGETYYIKIQSSNVAAAKIIIET